MTSPILPEEEVERLWAECDGLRVQRDAAEIRIAEIDRAIVASGEAKLRAIRELGDDLSDLEIKEGDR